jgi:hypothetical protein
MTSVMLIGVLFYLYKRKGGLVWIDIRQTSSTAMFHSSRSGRVCVHGEKKKTSNSEERCKLEMGGSGALLLGHEYFPRHMQYNHGECSFVPWMNHQSPSPRLQVVWFVGRELPYVILESAGSRSFSSSCAPRTELLHPLPYYTRYSN